MTQATIDSRVAAQMVILVALGIALGAAAGTARAQSRLNRAMKLEPGGRFVLDTFAGSVSVTGGSESGADVVVTSGNDEVQHDIDFTFQENPGDAEVRARWRGPWSIFGTAFLGLQLHYDVRVPKNTRVEIRTSGGQIQVFALAGDADLRTSGGRIDASQINGNVRATSSGGTISAEGIRGDADLATSGGGIDAKAIDGSLSARTSGGWIRMNGVGGRVDAHTSGGWIAATFNKGDSQGGELNTSGGPITAKIDPAANLEIDASTSGGGVRSDLPLRVTGSFSRDHLRGTLGSGGATLRMHTSGGSIRISGL
ncbi:MAG: DUF4097 family beta strand repeat protein [Acidobacteriota bacterium]|nr:DUF4097 family beta strand repeat protein [Acidobacteriota bacterium]